MAIICHEYNMLFIMTPRTACTALGSALISELNGKFIPSQDILDAKGFFKVQRKHCTLRDLLDNRIISKAQADELFKFTTVRNPFDTLVSRYEKLHSKYQPLLDDLDSWIHQVPGFVDNMQYCLTHSFDTWIRKTYLKTAIKRLLGRKPSMYRQFTTGMNAILHFEHLQKELDELSAKATHHFKILIPRINTTKERSADYRKYYSTTSRQLIQFAFKDDLKHYDYRF
jgi:hypothetical protein